LLVVNERADLRATAIDVAALVEQFVGNLLVRDDDEALVHDAEVVDGTILISPLLELEPQGEAWDVVHAANQGK
jgi:hypothetical protein